MSHRRLLMRALLLGAIGTSGANAAPVQSHPAIVVGEVSARTIGENGATLDLFRRLVEREIGRLALDQAKEPVAYVFSASLVRLDAHASADGARATCVVSGALRRAGSGAIVALLRGTGSVDGAPSALPGAKEKALEVAVHGAVRRLPEAM